MKRTITLMALLCLLFIFQSVFSQNVVNVDNPKPNNVYYDGSTQYLLIEGNTRGNENYHFWYENPITHVWSKDPANIPGGKYPGEYKAKWILINGEQDPNKVQANMLRYTEETVTISIKESDIPTPLQGLIYKTNDKQFLLDRTKAVYADGVTKLPINKDVFYFRLCPSNITCPEVKWDSMIPSASSVKAYRIEYRIDDPAITPELGSDADGYVWAEIKYQASDPSQIPGVDPQPGLRPSSNIPFYVIGDGSALFTDDVNLPATGFPTRFHKPLSLQPENINYEQLAMRIQIPVIDVDVELTGVPEVDDTWAVEWLNDRAGLLSRSAMPGEGYAMIAAHNHLNAEEIGPFALLFSLEENDRIFINTPEGGLQIYSVYANELLEPDDVQQMASIAQSEENSIILVTCENEMVDGGYMNRRTIFAKPVAVL